jgi:hypothetical protein
MAQKGSCHCGRIAFEVEGTPKQVIECNCSHCSRKGYLLWFVPRENLRLTTPEHELATYLFNKKATAAVNVRCLEDIDLGTLERKQVDGRSA